MTLWTVNGKRFGTDTIVAKPRLGTIEKWTIRARNVEHPFHIHLAPFQVIGRDGNDDPGRYNLHQVEPAIAVEATVRRSTGSGVRPGSRSCTTATAAGGCTISS